MSAAAPHLEHLAARPRPTGSAAVADARRYCAEVLRKAGFETAEAPFQFSGFPGRLGTPIGGAWLAIALTLAAHLAVTGHPLTAAGCLVAATALLGVVGGLLASRGVVRLGVMRETGVNLEATRPGMAPHVWLVAHIDSKWQPIPMLARAAGITTLALCALAALALATAGVSATGAWNWLTVVGWIGALPVLLSVVGARGPGALDNASGVAAVLTAASALPHSAPIGVLITDAEELGLAGARAWAARRQPGIALNCDGVDDTGVLSVMYSGQRPASLTAAIRHGAAGARVRIMPMIPGVLADNVAFTSAGWRSVTLSKGSLRTLQRIHTMSDDLAHLSGAGIDEVAHVLARAAQELCE